MLDRLIAALWIAGIGAGCAFLTYDTAARVSPSAAFLIASASIAIVVFQGSKLHRELD